MRRKDFWSNPKETAELPKSSERAFTERKWKRELDPDSPKAKKDLTDLRDSVFYLRSL